MPQKKSIAPQDPAEALQARFAPVLTTATQKLFGRLLAASKRLEEVDDATHVVFEVAGSERIWSLSPPIKKPSKRAPTAHADLLTVCGGMCWGEVGHSGQVVLTDGFSGTLHALGSDALPESLDFTYSKSLFSPIDIDSGDFYVVHPSTAKLLFPTEGIAQEVRKTNDPLEVYLLELGHKVLPGSPHRSRWLR